MANAFTRIARDEGVATFWRGCAPFVQRAMLVGIVQVGTFDQNKELYDRYAGLKRGTYPNVFAAAFTSGLLYSIISKIVMLSRFAALSVSLTQKVSLFQPCRSRVPKTAWRFRSQTQTACCPTDPPSRCAQASFNPFFSRFFPRFSLAFSGVPSGMLASRRGKQAENCEKRVKNGREKRPFEDSPDTRFVAPGRPSVQ